MVHCPWNSLRLKARTIVVLAAVVDADGVSAWQ